MLPVWFPIPIRLYLVENSWQQSLSEKSFKSIFSLKATSELFFLLPFLSYLCKDKIKISGG